MREPINLPLPQGEGENSVPRRSFLALGAGAVLAGLVYASVTGDKRPKART